jgi:hypothetical protein
MKLAQTSQEEFVSYLPDVHAISAGLKATISWWGCEVLERVRRSLGGYAYSSYNGIGVAIGDWGVVTTGKLRFNFDKIINYFIYLLIYLFIY